MTSISIIGKEDILKKSISKKSKKEIDAICKGIQQIVYYCKCGYRKKENRYEQYAEKLLDELFESMPVNIPHSDGDVLFRLGYGIIFLFREGLLKENEEELLQLIDGSLYYLLAETPDKQLYNWADIACYLQLRIAANVSEKYVLNQLTNKQNLLFSLNCLEKCKLEGRFFDNRIIKELKQLHQLRISPVQTGRLLDLKEKNETNDPYITLSPLIEEQSITFVIPLRIDSLERVRNLDTLLILLSRVKRSDILILEADDKSNYQLKTSHPRVKHLFVKDCDPVFHRTKYLNRMLREANSAVVGVWDTDVIVPEWQIMDAAQAIRQGKAIMAFPYNGSFCTLSEEDSNRFVQEMDMNFLEKQTTFLKKPAGCYSVGGAFLVNRDIYLSVGGENEYFYGWGPEDVERVKRIEILNLPIYRTEGALFHLHHPRKESSWFASKKQERINREEYFKVCALTKPELSHYIQTWEWNTRNRTPYISVIMPTYNMSQYVKEAIDSILNQTFRNFELIVVNDASTDQSQDIIDSYSNQKLVLVKNEHNLGNYPARNRALLIAKGKYICVMDADDIAYPNRLEIQFKYMEKHSDVLACGSQSTYIGSNLSLPKPLNYEDIKLQLLDNNRFIHSSLIIRTDIMKELGGYNEEYIYSSDYDLICRIALRGKIVNLPDVLMQYRIHKSQISNKHRLEQIVFANKIRKSYQSEMIKLFQAENINMPPEAALNNPVVGQVIFLNHYAKKMKNHQFKEIADNLLHRLLKHIYTLPDAQQTKAVEKLRYGLIYLLENNFAIDEHSLHKRAGVL